MNKQVAEYNILFKTKDVFGKLIRTTKQYWQYIGYVKHRELKGKLNTLKTALTNPKEVRLSLQDPNVRLFYKKINKHSICVVVKYLNSSGFVVTAYITGKENRKGKILWPKKGKK